MKKKLSVVLLFVSLSFVVSSARAEGKNPDTGQAYGSGGCGWGSMYHGHKTTKGGQLLALTTNGTGFHTIAMTMGTSNCSDIRKKSHAEAQRYIESNRIAFANDVARGSGEAIAGLSQILGCTDATTLSHSLKGNYGTIFPDPNVGSASITKSVVRTIEDQSQLICKGV